MEQHSKKQLTVMIAFAGDNALSPSMLYQVNSIKTAGFHCDVNVVVHFDPSVRGVPSRLFEINQDEKKNSKSRYRIGDEMNPFIRPLIRDTVEIDKSVDGSKAADALEKFLKDCHERYPAEHYMLFLVGHGLVVGQDEFLPDENPESAITLKRLGNILHTFSTEIREADGVLELIGMHSCAMSSIEVAYELMDTAKYMIASEGLSFVGTWPYRQLLQKIFCFIDQGNGQIMNFGELMGELYNLILHNGANFTFAGYSEDLCLCSLEKQDVEALTKPIQKLAKALKAGLKSAPAEDQILLAHLRSQSYFQERYADLYDFCSCLAKGCENSTDNEMVELESAAKAVMNILEPRERENSKGPVLQADFVGPETQYSHGLSIYFPWTRPVADGNSSPLKRYKKYVFSTHFDTDSWVEFVDDYFTKTMRRARRKGMVPNPKSNGSNEMPVSGGDTAGAPPGTSPEALTKVSAADSSGVEDWGAIKNHPSKYLMSKRVQEFFYPDNQQRDTDQPMTISANRL